MVQNKKITTGMFGHGSRRGLAPTQTGKGDHARA